MTVDRDGLTEKLQKLQKGPAFQALLHDPQASLVHRAVQWIAEWNTFRWTFELNVRGIAPSSSDIRDTYLEQIPEPMRESVAEHMAAVRTDVKTQKDWSAKYRRHWGLQYRKLGIGHDLTEDEIRARVPIKCPRIFFDTQKRPPEMGVRCFQKWLPVLVMFALKQRTQKWPQMTPKSGSPKKYPHTGFCLAAVGQMA